MLRDFPSATTFKGLHTAYPQIQRCHGAREGELYPVVEKYVEESIKGLAPKQYELKGVR